MNRSFILALEVTARSVPGDITRTPRPFICWKKPADATFRMKKTHSIGFTSVPPICCEHTHTRSRVPGCAGFQPA